MMKKTLIYILLAAVIMPMIIISGGCAKYGETLAEGHRRHKRILNLNHQGLIEDIDMILMMDEPSRRTRYRIK